MNEASPAQHAAYASGDLPAIEELREGVWSVPVPMPNAYHPYSLCYLIEDERGALHAIDPGWTSADNTARMTDAVRGIGKTVEDVATVIGTHSHPDHLGMGEWLRRASGAQVLVHPQERSEPGPPDEPSGGVTAERLDEWAVPVERRSELESLRYSPPPIPDSDAALADGGLLPVPGRTLRVVHTPGHTPGSVCVHDPDEGVLFSGDHILPVIHPGLGLGGPTASNPIADYVESLERIGSLGEAEVAPGHEYRFHGLEARCRTLAGHHLRRTREVDAALASDPAAPVWEIAAGLTWTAGWAGLRDFYLMSALAQTAMHVEFVRSGAADRHL